MKTFLHLFQCWLSSKMPKMLEHVSGMNQTTNALCLPLTFCVHWYTTRTNQMSKRWFLGKYETFWRSVASVLEKCVTAACLLLVSKPVSMAIEHFSSLESYVFWNQAYMAGVNWKHASCSISAGWGVRNVSNWNMSYKAGGFFFFVCFIVFFSLYTCFPFSFCLAAYLQW